MLYDKYFLLFCDAAKSISTLCDRRVCFGATRGRSEREAEVVSIALQFRTWRRAARRARRSERRRSTLFSYALGREHISRTRIKITRVPRKPFSIHLRRHHRGSKLQLREGRSREIRVTATRTTRVEPRASAVEEGAEQERKHDPRRSDR